MSKVFFDEINRIVTDSISDWISVTEKNGIANLRRRHAAPSEQRGRHPDPARYHRVAGRHRRRPSGDLPGAPALGIPCFKLRENTDRPITIEEGTNVLVGTTKGKILAGDGQSKAPAGVSDRGE